MGKSPGATPRKANPYDKKFYWIKLMTDFFVSDDMRMVQAQKNGEKYIIFYLKLLLKAIEQEHIGVLRYKSKFPYTADILATVTDTDIDTVRSAMALFQQMGMVEIDEAGSILVDAVHEMVGSMTGSAVRMKRLRAREAAKQIEDQSNGKASINRNAASQCDEEIEKEIEIEKEEEKEVVMSEEDQQEFGFDSPVRSRSFFLPTIVYELHQLCNLTEKIQANHMTEDLFNRLQAKGLLNEQYLLFVANLPELKKNRSDGKLNTGAFINSLDKGSIMIGFKQYQEKAAAEEKGKQSRWCPSCENTSQVRQWEAMRGCPVCRLDWSKRGDEETVAEHRQLAIRKGLLKAE